MKRLEHLKSLALGNNVKTYFMPPDNSIFPNMKVMGDLFNSNVKDAISESTSGKNPPQQV